MDSPPCQFQGDRLEHLDGEVDQYLAGQKRPLPDDGPPGKRAAGYQSPVTTFDELMKEAADGLNPDHFVTVGEFADAIIAQLPLEEITAADEAAVRKFVKECGVLLVSSDDDSGDDSGDDAQAAPAFECTEKGTSDDEATTRAAVESSSESELDLSEPAKCKRPQKKRKTKPKTPCHAKAGPVLEARFNDVKATVDAAPLQTWTNLEPTPNPEGACIQQQRAVTVFVGDTDGNGEALSLQTLSKGNGIKGMPDEQYNAIGDASNSDDLEAYPDDMPTTTPPFKNGGCVFASNGPIHVAPTSQSYFGGKKNPPKVFLVTQGVAKLVTMPSGKQAFTMSAAVTKMYNTGSTRQVDREEPLGDVDDMVLNMLLRVAKDIGWSNVRIVTNDGQSQSDKDMAQAITKSLWEQHERIKARHGALQEMNNVIGRAMPAEFNEITATLPLMAALTFAANKRGTEGESWKVVQELAELAKEHAPLDYPHFQGLLEASATNPEVVIGDITKTIDGLVALAEDPLSNISPTVKVVIDKLAMVAWGLTSESPLDRQQTLFACKLVLWKWFEVNELQKTQEQLAICTEAIGKMRALAASGNVEMDMIDEILTDVREAPAPAPAMALGAELAPDLREKAIKADRDLEAKLIAALRGKKDVAKQTLIAMLKDAGEITKDGDKYDYKRTMPKAARAFADSITQDDPPDWHERIHVFIEGVIEKVNAQNVGEAAKNKMNEGYDRPVGAARSTLFATAASEIIKDAQERAAEVEREQEAIKQALEQNAASALASRPKRKRRAPQRLVEQDGSKRARTDSN